MGKIQKMTNRFIPLLSLIAAAELNEPQAKADGQSEKAEICRALEETGNLAIKVLNLSWAGSQATCDIRYVASSTDHYTVGEMHLTGNSAYESFVVSRKGNNETHLIGKKADGATKDLVNPTEETIKSTFAPADPSMPPVAPTRVVFRTQNEEDLPK